jgi:glycosyltransferase involved in cell wall biosynthesis
MVDGPGLIEEPLVSVGLPTFNRAPTLSRAVESVLSQTYQNFELVISDNCSTDATHDLCEQIARRDRRVRYIRQDKNIGPTGNFLQVLEEATGEYFMWLADDDWISSDYVKACLSALRETPGCVLVCGQAAFTGRGNVKWRGETMQLVGESPRDRILKFWRQVRYNSQFYGLAPRQLMLQVPLRQGLAFDWLFVATVLSFGKAITVPDVLLQRSGLGVSENLPSLLRALEVPSYLRPRIQFDVVGLTIAWLVVREIGWLSPVFGKHSALWRLCLAIQSAYVLFVRLIVPAFVGRLRSTVRVRTRFRQFQVWSTNACGHK